MKKPFILALLGLLSTAFAENLDIPEAEVSKYENHIFHRMTLGYPDVSLCNRMEEYAEHVTEVENRVSARIRREAQEKEERERKKAEEDRRKEEKKAK